jgi:tryptophan 2,3-dioxygenase
MPHEPRSPAPGPPEKGFGKDALLSYGSYLKVPQLLDLQAPQSAPPHHDELQFIIVHQTYELWFKLVLFELEAVRGHMFAGRLDDARMGLGRVHAIEKVLLQQVHVLETMTPIGFLGFRDHLRPASGFQSVQFRELEILSGLRDPNYLDFLVKESGADVRASVERRLAEPSLRDAMHALLAAHGFDIGRDASRGTCDESRLDEALLRIYRTLEPRDVYHVLEALMEHDEGITLWRYHHVAMVERIIGTKSGTGGSSGAAYLKSTTARKFFPELWKVRGALAPDAC